MEGEQKSGRTNAYSGTSDLNAYLNKFSKHERSCGHPNIEACLQAFEKACAEKKFPPGKKNSGFYRWMDQYPQWAKCSIFNMSSQELQFLYFARRKGGDSGPTMPVSSSAASEAKQAPPPQPGAGAPAVLVGAAPLGKPKKTAGAKVSKKNIKWSLYLNPDATWKIPDVQTFGTYQYTPWEIEAYATNKPWDFGSVPVTPLCAELAQSLRI